MDEVNKYDKIDRLEKALLQQPAVQCKLSHVFAPGLYMRSLEIPAGTIVTSKIHKTEHPFILLKGKVSVLINEEVVEYLEAPYQGITHPGTRRVVLTHEDTIWMTVHATDKQTPEEVEEDIIEKHENKYLTDEEKLMLKTSN